MTNEFQSRQNIEMTRLPSEAIFCRAARKASRDKQPALNELELKRMAKEFDVAAEDISCPGDGTIVAEAFSSHSGPTMAVVRELISETLKINAYINQIGVGFIGGEWPCAVLSLHTAPHTSTLGEIPPVSFCDNFLPLGEPPEPGVEPTIPYTPSPLKIIGKTPAGSLMVKGVRAALEKHAGEIGGFVLEEPLGVENLPSFLVISLIETSLGYCAHRLEVSFDLEVAELISTDPESASVVPFVKKD